MKRPTFLEGVCVALVVSALGALAFSVLTTVFAIAPLRLVIALIGFAYVVYLQRRSSERAGRVALLAAWLAGAAALWFTALPLSVYVVAHVGMLWLMRSVYFHTSALSALADLGLSAVALAIAISVAVHTHSLFLSLWCFFLVQALFALLPKNWRPDQRPGSVTPDERFETAHRAAEAALRRLSSTH